MNAQALARGLLLGGFVFAAAGAKAEPVAHYALSYDVPIGCPSEDAFRGLVQVDVVDAATDRRPSARVTVHIESLRGGFSGRLELERLEQSRVTRELRAPTCEELTQALGFVLALALEGREQPGSAEVADKALTQENAGAVSEDGALDVPPVASRSAAGYSLATSSPELEAPASRVERKPSLWGFGSGVALATRSGLGPSATWIESVFAEVFRRRRATPFRPSARVSLQRSATITQADAEGTTEFSWWAVGLEACALDLSSASWLSLKPYVTLNLGALGTSGHPATGPVSRGRASSAFWMDVSPGLRVQIFPRKHLFIEAAADLIVPITQYRVAFDSPDTLVHQVPEVAAAARFGLGVLFP